MALEELGRAPEAAEGGLDAFVLSTPAAKLGKKARVLKRRVQKAQAGQESQASA